MGIAEGAFCPTSFATTAEASKPSRIGFNQGLQQSMFALFGLGFGPIWIGEDVAPQIKAMEAMAPAERSTLSIRWAEDFVLHGKKPGAQA